MCDLLVLDFVVGSVNDVLLLLFLLCGITICCCVVVLMVVRVCENVNDGVVCFSD